MKKNTFRLIYIAFFTAILFLPALTLSCTRTPPEITYGYLQLVLYQGENGPQEQFSLFIMPEDEDGIENLEELYLYHDREQLRWRISSDEWIHFNNDGKDWIGTRSIALTKGELPRGQYRAVLVSKGGESAERSFTYDGNVRFPFPEIEISGGTYTVKSQWPVNRLISYDQNGNYQSTVTLRSLSGSVSGLGLTSGARTVSLWAEDETNFCSAYTNAVPLN